MSCKTVRLIGVVGALWNLVGVVSYLAHAGMVGDAARPPEGSVAMPAAVTAAFAIAVFGGVLGSLGLALLKSWAKPVLWVSFAATLVNWGWVFLYSDAASIPLGVAVVVIALALVWVAGRAPLGR